MVAMEREHFFMEEGKIGIENRQKLRLLGQKEKTLKKIRVQFIKVDKTMKKS